MSVSRLPKDAKIVKSINLRALQIYKDMFGDLRVLPNFVIRTSKFKRVPAYFNGFKLGKHVSLVREWYNTDKSVFNAEDLKKADEMGFAWSLQDPKVELVRLSFKVYQMLYGNCEVPLDYVIPSSDEWPDISWGLRLGEILHSIRSEGSYKAIHADLKELGVDFNVQSSTLSRFERIYDGLKSYLEIYGDLDIPRKYIVPLDSEDFPRHTLGLQLGEYQMLH